MKAFHEIRKYDSNYKVWHKSYENISFVAHWHKEIELIYVREGKANINISNNSFVANKGDLIICDTGDIHYSNSPGCINTIDFIIFDTSIISSMYEYSHFSSPVIKKEDLDKYHLNHELDQLITILKSELNKKEHYYEEIVDSSIRKFWYLLKRNVPVNISNSQSQNNRTHMLNNFQELLSYIDKNYFENITLDFAAQHMHFSPSHFSKVFKDFTGINFVKYINLIRVEHAMEKLYNSSNNVTEIALDCGFNNVRNFNRVFKSVTGYTPTEFAALPDKESYNIGYYQRKSSEKQYVENDSITIVKNKQ